MKDNLQTYNNPKFLKENKSKNGIVKLFDGVKDGYFKSSFCLNRIYSIDGVSPTLTTLNDASFQR